jgi:hypothetical protein
MKSVKMLAFLMLLTVFIVGCIKESDEDQIRELLETSHYIGDGMGRSLNDSTNVPQSPSGPYSFATDTFPSDVRWVRWVETPITTVYNIVVEGDSADATITKYIHGEPSSPLADVPNYGFFVDNDYGMFGRAISDSAVRKIKLYNDGDGWHILSLTAADLFGVGQKNSISITEITAEVESRGYVWSINSSDIYYTKDELPTFEPSDTIDVTVTISVPDRDSCWSFLHHGAGHRPGFGLRRHHRDPFYRDDTYTFSRTWQIADDSVTYGVRHAAVDVIIWGALFGDSTAAYYARAWAMPYIVKAPDQDIPQDIP